MSANPKESLREKLYRAAIHCSHSITHTEIRLDIDFKQSGNALSQLADRLIAVVEPLESEVEELKTELERERIRLAACGVVALSNTPESAVNARQMSDEYKSASCDGVAMAVDREMKFRNKSEELEREVTELRAKLAAYESAQEITVPDDMQEWAGMDGATAFHLIERHADNWSDAGKMMHEWLSANIPQPKEGE